MILVTGATGYVGGRLVPRLWQKGYKIRCLVRDASRLKGRWEGVEIVQGNVLEPESLNDKFIGIETAYYLIHSMGGDGEFSRTDIVAAENFAFAAEKQGVKRIIYLGGLGSPEETLSKHLSSRLKTGDTLRKFDVPVTEFRAGVIVGSGSLSFEMIRYLTERLIVMITPKWVNTRTQPIAIRDVLRYLIDALKVENTRGEIIEIGGEDILTYKDLMRIYADIRGLKRYFIKVPVLTPKLSSHWIGLVTPLPSRIAKPLVDGLKNELICKSNKARELFNFKTISYNEAVKLALQQNKTGKTETIWFSSYSSGTKNKITPVHSGDPLDFWRVEAIENNRLLRLRAEMILPGEAWLQFNVENTNGNNSILTQTAFFEPRGLWGLLYWYLVYPLHGLIFGGMLKSLKKRAERI
ncbi:MAG: SDR family oxidoreductase [Ignavibacteriaceae bacterium]